MPTTLQLSNQEVQKCCKSYFLSENAEENLTIIKYELVGLGGTPTGFLGSHKMLNVHLVIGFVEKSLRFFFKAAPENVQTQMEYMTEFGVFEKEIAVYEKIIPKLQNINSMLDNFSPKCFLTSEKFLVLENLAEQGFRLGAKRDGILTMDHLVCALQTLANMHAASLVLEHKVGRNIPDMFPNILDENAYPSNVSTMRTKYIGKSIGALCELVKLIPKYRDSKNLAYILEEFPKKLKLIFEFCKTSKKYRNTFQHGDLWANNLMFSYDENEKPIDCRLIDFQLARYSPPILDIITVLTIPTTSEFRRNNLQNLIDYYWNALQMNMEKHKLKLENFINHQEFYESVSEFKLAGIIESCLFSHLTLLPEQLVTALLGNSNDFGDFINNRNDLCTKAFQSDQLYRERLTDMITDIIDNYIL